MESFEFRFAGKPGFKWQGDGKLVGVVGSGNLEVMIESAELSGACLVTGPRQ
jgi:malonate decarboxylase delta subunit